MARYEDERGEDVQIGRKRRPAILNTYLIFRSLFKVRVTPPGE